MKIGLENLKDETYDSKPDTLKHIDTVRKFLAEVTKDLDNRAKVHDQSKLENPEKAIFDEMTPKLKDSEYGSDEYNGFLKKMKPALDHHYANNSHHPEHYKDGIDGMCLLDLVEMLCDWKAATQRHTTGDILKSLEINKDRFKISPQLYSILKNTIMKMGWNKK